MNSRETGKEAELESWKEIAAYLGRQVKTVQRWEKEEGLPIHRHSHNSRASVYAYPSEIDVWRASRKTAVEIVPPPARPLWRVPAFVLAVLLCLMTVGNGIRPQAASAQQKHPIAKRLVFSGDTIDRGADFSPDGHSMVFTDWNDSEDLAIRDMLSGKVTRLFAKPATLTDSDADAEGPAFSPDRRQIAYFWDPGGKESKVQLRVMANQPGGKSRILIDSRDYNAFPAAWFPDGKSILVTLRTQSDRTQQLARVSVSDGAVKALKSLEWRFTSGRPNLSPDGRYVVYSALAVNPSKPPTGRDLARNPNLGGDRHIYVLAVDGSGETEIVKTSGINKNPIWTPDGKHILFTSDRSGKVDLWSVAMQSGKAIGGAAVVRAEIGDVTAFGIYGGSYYYEYKQPATDYIHIVAPVPSTGNARESESFVGIRPTWSPDGKSIAFKRHHPGSETYDLVIHSLETGEERTYPQNLGTTGDGRAMWFHDGTAVIMGIGYSNDSRLIYRVNVKTGEIMKLQGAFGPSALSPDDRTLYVALDKMPGHVVSVDLATGQQREIFVAPTAVGVMIALSPDGRTLALGWLDRPPDGAKLHIARVAVDGSGFREVFTRTDHLFGASLVAWSKDGRAILFNQEQPGGADHWGIMQVSADSRGTASLVISTPPMQGFDPSPDGSRIAYSARESGDELWALDNVLSALK